MGTFSTEEALQLQRAKGTRLSSHYPQVNRPHLEPPSHQPLRPASTPTLPPRFSFSAFPPRRGRGAGATGRKPGGRSQTNRAAHFHHSGKRDKCSRPNARTKQTRRELFSSAQVQIPRARARRGSSALHFKPFPRRNFDRIRPAARKTAPRFTSEKI